MKTSVAYPASWQTKHGKGKRKGKTHHVVAALTSTHLNQVRACSTKTDEWNKAHSNLCLLKEMVPYWTGLHYMQLQEKTGNPEQIPDAWLKPGLKIDKQP